MKSRWLSFFEKGILPVCAAMFLGACEITDVAGPGSEETESSPIEGAGGGNTMALRLNRELLKIVPKEAGKNWVFDAYSDPKTREVAWSRFWTRKIDFTGVSWDHKRNVTMITPRHGVMAKHYVRPPGTVVRFHDKRGVEVQRAIQGVVKLTGPYDVAVVILNEAMPSGVAHYPMLEPSDSLHTDLTGALALVTDQQRKVHVHECGSSSVDNMAFRRSKSMPQAFYEPLIAGDSGNPAFLMVRGEPVLIETHHYGGAGSGPFYGSAKIQDGIRAAIVELAKEFGGGQYSIRTVRP